MVALSVLVSGLEAEMVRLGYKDSTMVWYHGAWRRLQRYFAARGVEEFSLDVAMEWVDEACGFFAREQAGTLRQTDVYLFRVAQMLGDYELHGAVLRRYSRTVSKLTGDEAAVVARFDAWLRAAERSASTVRSYGTLAAEFSAFAGTRGGLARCDAGMIGAFTATLAGYQAKTVEQKLGALRSFLRFASEAGLTAATAEAVPAVPSRKRARIPPVWDPGDVTRILDAVDRGNPCGKRDYAIILLVTRLGLRSIDVKRLEFSGFDWPGSRLSVARARTGGRIWLPLLKDVGWAVIDYVRNGRPASDCPQVFLRHTAPVGPFSDQDHLHQTMVKYARAAHVPVSDKRRHGMHSLRHTPATRLMEDGTPVEQIAGILGHQSVASTGVYLKSSPGLLSRCGPGPRRDRGRAGGTVSGGMSLAGAITALAAEKRAVGCKYDAEERILARFEAFCREEFPGLDTVTKDSAEAWITAARRRGVRPATLQGLAAPVRELARWLGRRGIAAYVLPARTLPGPARYVPHICTDGELADLFAATDRCHYSAEVPFRHLVMPVLFRTVYACGLFSGGCGAANATS